MLLTYLIPMCIGVLPDRYVEILNELRLAVNLILQIPFSETTLKAARKKFVDVLNHCIDGLLIYYDNIYIQLLILFLTEFGEICVTAKMHLTMHLHDCVANIGPLAVYHCYHSENHYGQMRDLCKSTHSPTLGIARNNELSFYTDLILHLPSISLLYIYLFI